MIKDLLKSRPVILGRVKLGDKGGDKGQPRKFDGFRIYQAGKDSAGQPMPDPGLQALYESKYGVPLRRIPIFFLYNTLAANFDCNYQYHKKFDGMDVLVCEGDGEKASQCIPEKTQEKGYKLKRDEAGNLVRKEVKCPCERFNPEPGADQKLHPCKWAAKMSFMLADVPKGGGYYLFRTHSLNSIKNLHFALSQMESFTFGNMAGIPVDLVVEPQKNTKNMTIYVARIEWAFDPRAMRLKAIEEVKSVAHLKAEIATAEAAAHRLLAAPDPDEDIADEFYPDTQDATPAAPKPSAIPAESKLADMLNPGLPIKPETTAERLNRELTEERARNSAPETPSPAPPQAAQDASQAPKKRGRKPKAQQPAPAVQQTAQPATAPSAPAPTPASPAPPAEQADLIEQDQDAPVPDVTSGKQAEGEDVNARFF